MKSIDLGVHQRKQIDPLWIHQKRTKATLKFSSKQKTACNAIFRAKRRAPQEPNIYKMTDHQQEIIGKENAYRPNKALEQKSQSKAQA